MKAKALALISGKGGSGKTTLALSISRLLSLCGIRVLLVDCDMSTNGATYFFEDKLKDAECDITTFYDIVYNDDQLKDICPIDIAENFAFIPSISKIGSNYSIFDTPQEDNMAFFFSKTPTMYDVIIYDCQAGFSEVSNYVLPESDIHLAVMEADAISSSAMRSLYLKIARYINEKKIYQVFNKATKEEYDVYSKLGGGTFFTNVETVRFDWKIRHAFSIAQIPDMLDSSVEYGKQVYKICSVLFPESSLIDKYQHYWYILEAQRNKEIMQNVDQQMKEINQKTKSGTLKRKYQMISIGALTVAMLIILITVFEMDTFKMDSTAIGAILVAFCILLIMCTVSLIEFKNQMVQRVKAEDRLMRLETAYYEAEERWEELQAKWNESINGQDM